ncbi:hypothetical protein [Pseudolabrys sp. FHR47]|uniref:hypothetical protein n=1 Tax=Pseudolabrys sp. FHR47 TaxID=2562284 RepID=UPI0010BE386D|nr:hypothetical protein [Pseudolabrys sp. FHR47]
MQYRRTHRNFTPEAIADIRQRYVETDEPQQSIAVDYGVHRKTIDQLARREDWPRRQNRAPREVPQDLKLAKEAAEAMAAASNEATVRAGTKMSESERAALADRLERQVELQLAELERRQTSIRNDVSANAENDRAARIVGRLTDTLSKVRHLRLPDTVNEEQIPASDIPKDIDEFRHGLARRIRDFVRSRADRRIPESEIEPSGTDTPR